MKRYRLEGEPQEAEMVEDPDGEYVEHEEIARLMALIQQFDKRLATVEKNMAADMEKPRDHLNGQMRAKLSRAMIRLKQYREDYDHYILSENGEYEHK